MNTTYAGQACGGQSINPLSRGNIAPVPAKALDIPAGRIEQLVKDGHALASRVDEVADRLLGTEQQEAVETCAVNGERLAYTGMAGQYQTLADELERLIARLSRAAVRLERA